MSSLTIPVADADNPALLHALTDNMTLRTLRRLTRTRQVVSEITAIATRLGIRTDDAEVARHLDALDADHVVGPSRVTAMPAVALVVFGT